jgi:hypothetical protein
LQGSATGAFAATVTVPLSVELSGVPIFGWCAYATDRPPAAIAKQGGYTLQGTPPFIIQTLPGDPGSTVSVDPHNYTDCNIYALTDATGCPGDNPPPIPSITGFTTSAASICAGQSATLTADATDAELYSFDDGVTWGNSASTVVSPSTTTTYTLKVTRAAGGCTVTYGTPIEITVRPQPALEFVNPPALLCVNTEAVLTVNDLNNAGSSYCFTYECAGCMKNAYLTGNDDPAAAGCHWFSECIYSEANTYTISMYDAGTMTIWAKAKTQYGCVDSVKTTIGKADNTLTIATNNPAPLCGAGAVSLNATAGGEIIAPMTYTWNVGNDPPQTTATGSYAPQVEVGSTTYSVSVTNAAYCISAAGTGTITVHGTPTITLAVNGSNYQTVTEGTAMTAIKYNTTNASGASISGQPPGVSGSWTSGVYTISGTPSSTGTFNYTVTTQNSNGCTNVKATGQISTCPKPSNSATWKTCTGFTMISNAQAEKCTNMSHANAVTTCTAKGSGWRLPTQAELKCIAQNYTTVPGGVNDYGYWTSTTNTYCFPANFWCASGAASAAYVKCVKN